MQHPEQRSPVGKVYLVGAGPGDPGLITLQGVRCLMEADVVLYDYLVNPHLLQHTRPEAERVGLGSHAGRSAAGRRWTQDEINQQMVRLAQTGKTVVRLKGGDPAVFGHLEEELDALDRHQIPYEIVPGITAALAAGSHAGIPLTQRDDASAVALITGREFLSKPGQLDWSSLAKFPGTLVIYMGVTTVDVWSQGLLQGGMPAETPVALVRRCSWPDQQIVHTNLGDVASALVPRSQLPPPVIAVVGAVANRARARNWFAQRPLVGQRILITRPEHQMGSLNDRLMSLGAETFLQPAIEIGPPDDWTPLDRAIDRIGEFHWIVFSSANGVRYFFDRLWHLRHDLRTLSATKIAVIGPGTAAELEHYHLRADCQPAEHRAEALVEALAPQAGNGRFLLVRASRGREVLAEGLRTAGADVEQVVAYFSRDVPSPDDAIKSLMASGKIDWTTVTSSAIATSLAAMFGSALHNTRLVSISPITSATLRELGYTPAAEATTYTTSGVVDAIVAGAAV